jgi:hypothetical protein
MAPEETHERITHHPTFENAMVSRPHDHDRPSGRTRAEDATP